jgi:hypothetical protein
MSLYRQAGHAAITMEHRTVSALPMSMSRDGVDGLYRLVKLIHPLITHFGHIWTRFAYSRWERFRGIKATAHVSGVD